MLVPFVETLDELEDTVSEVVCPAKVLRMANENLSEFRSYNYINVIQNVNTNINMQSLKI